MYKIKNNFFTKFIDETVIFMITLLWVIVYLINEDFISVDVYVNSLIFSVFLLMLLKRRSSIKYFYAAYIFIILSVLVTLFDINVLMSAFSSIVVGLLGIGLINQLFFNPRAK